MSVMRRLGNRHGAWIQSGQRSYRGGTQERGGTDRKDRSGDAGANAVANGGTALGREGSDKNNYGGQWNGVPQL